MYSCGEIRSILARCTTVSEVLQASEAFEALIEEGALNEEQKRFSKSEEIVRIRQIRAVNRSKK